LVRFRDHDLVIDKRDGSANRETRRIEINITPSEPEYLTAAHPGPGKDERWHAIAAARDEPKEPAEILRAPGAHLWRACRLWNSSSGIGL
jgi:hypothetical protein